MVVLSELPIGSSSSSSSNVQTYDVFLSFRGVDTRLGFTNYLHNALIDANITTFLDDEEIETGEDLKPELESAIKTSQASIIVLSKNYATSTWCLDELVLILEQRITSNHIVIPIFYHVEPTHVRKLQGSFGDAIAKHKERMEEETDANKRNQWAQKIDRWTKALTEIADLKGKDVKGRPEKEFIEEIVKDIYHRLPKLIMSSQSQLIGMEYNLNFVTSWLKDASLQKAYILTIYGIGGIGKTSLAKHPKSTSCIEDISSKCNGKFDGLLEVQKQLCGDISKPSSIEVHDVSVYTSMIENVVARKRVFLVLDDIDTVDQLDALLGNKGFHPGSKIIITTRNSWLTQSCALFKANIKPNYVERLLRGLHEIESLQLFCHHAFTCNHPKAGYEEVSEKLVEYCQGHPLALKVLGKSLHNQDVSYWEGCIKGLNKEMDSRVNHVLRMSFLSLPSEDDKELFKYIACYFVGIDKDVTETILEACGMNISFGIKNLIDRCLLDIVWNNELYMHQLVQEMGRFEVFQESRDKPWKRSLLWSNEDSLKVLKQNKGKGKVKGLALDMRMLEKEKSGASFELKTDALSSMDSLKLLQLNYVQMKGSYANFPAELRSLCMHGFQNKSIPSELPMENLVTLDMSYSNIESFVGCYSYPQRIKKFVYSWVPLKSDRSYLKDNKLLPSLKILDLSYCEQLCSLGDFDQLPSLERLIVRNCISLVEVCESIEQCVELVFIDLSYCKKLTKLPRNIGMLQKVKTMLLDGCNLNINTITPSSSSAFVVDIPRDLKLFSIRLPSSLVTLSLEDCNLSTESFPMDFSYLFMLKELKLDTNPISSLPSCVRTLPRLEVLSMSFCDKLKSVEHPPRTLRSLQLYSGILNSVKKVVWDPEMAPLSMNWYLLRGSIHGPFEIQGMIKVEAMVGVEEKVLRSLSWTRLDFLNQRHKGTNPLESEIQMFYEFGIFSTIYNQEEMPSWVRHRSVGPSISFTIPSSPNKLRGLNFCSLLIQCCPLGDNPCWLYADNLPHRPMITISNVTKNQMWIYQRCWDRFYSGCCVMLSHWMFGRNEMEAGDHLTITVTVPHLELTKECGVSLVYEEEEEEEEDALGYYKSWNHIIGGDLSPFQTTTGQYLLDIYRFKADGIILDPYHRKFIPDGPDYQEKESPWFRALSPRKPDVM